MNKEAEGVDVSGTDPGAINWRTCKASGRSFGIARANYKLTRDTDFVENWPLIKEVGLVRGAYLFWDPVNDPVALADSVWDTVVAAGGVGPGDLPICVDVEAKHSLEGSGVSPTVAIEKLTATVQRLTTLMGIAPMIYTSHRVWIEQLKDAQAPALAGCPLWAVRWSPAEPQCPDVWGPGNWWIHQYAGDQKGVPGVFRKADLNRFHMVSEGMEGPVVSFIQRRLDVKITSRFDEATLDAVHAIQEQHGLRVDGVVGPMTWAQIVWRPQTDQ